MSVVNQVELVTKTLPSLSKRNFLVFMKAEMGLEVARPQREWWSVLKQPGDCVFLSPRDSGKMLASHTEVLTSLGWKTHGTLRVGDKIFTPTGDQSPVIAISEEGMVDLKVMCSDGSSLICHENHEWEVLDRLTSRIEVLETKQLLAEGLYTSDKTPRWLLPLVESFKCNDVTFKPSRKTILSIEKVIPQSGQCITIKDSRGVYLAGRQLTPTHNSVAIVRAYGIWKAKYDPYIKEILILGADADSAVGNLEKIKQDLSENPSLKFLIPHNRRNYNTSQKVKLSNGVVFRAKGFLSPLRGRHPQLILMDDVLNEKNSSSDEGRKKIRSYFFGVVFPMKDKGTRPMQKLGYKPKIVVVGTAQNEDDLYSELRKNKGFMSIKQSAIVDEETKEVLWPERYSWDDLMLIKSTMGTLQFSKEYLNEPLTDETTIFPVSLFAPLLDSDLSYTTNYQGSNPTYLGADFSVPGEVSGDYTALIVAEKLEDATLIILNVYRKRGVSLQDQISAIEDRAIKFNLTYGLLEANMFQKVYAEHFKNYTNYPIQGHVVTASGKNSLSTGVLSLRTLFENKKIIFPYKTDHDKSITDLIIREFSGLIRKNGKLGNFRDHDDCALALYHLVTASRQQMFEYSF